MRVEGRGGFLTNFFNKVKNTVLGIKGNTLYYPGCLTKYYLGEVYDKYKALLSDLGISFKLIDDLVCCGSPLLNAGYKDDFEEVKKKNLALLKKHNITKIITNCPHCYDVFRNQYLLNTQHITQILEVHKHKLAHYSNEEITYHDSCLLARKNKVIKEPRILLKQIGLKLLEPSKSREKTFCCGAGCGLKQNKPSLANQIAKERLSHFRTKKVVTACPYCYLHLSENAENKKIFEISQVLSEEV